MAQSFEDRLLQAIKKDDLKAFDALTENTQRGAYRLGRFPVLSLLYLYKSRRILSAYEQSFLQISNFETLSEPLEISKKFSAKAGKCLRLYLNETVSPLEMLLILEETARVKKLYPMTKTSSDIKGRLKAIYNIKYSLSVKFEGNAIVMDRRPLNRREKKRLLTVCLSLVLIVAIAVGVPVTTVSLRNRVVVSDVFELSQIDFASANHYALKQDITLPENYSVGKVNCTIDGRGKKLIAGKGASLGELNGKISDLILDSSGTALFTSLSENGIIENVTVNVNSEDLTAESGSFLAIENFGTIDGVTLNASGVMRTANYDEARQDSPCFGGIVYANSIKYNYSTQTRYFGTVKNCRANFQNFSLIGFVNANYSFGGIAGTNNSYLQDCSAQGAIASDTFDAAGLCAENNGILSGSANDAEISQISNTGWYPTTCGIALRNNGTLENCENSGKISSVSNCEKQETEDGDVYAAFAAGITDSSVSSSNVTSYIKDCLNSGTVESAAENADAYAAGVCRTSNGMIEGCKNSGMVSGRTNSGFDSFVGGIAALSYGNIVKSINEGGVVAFGGDSAIAGGISAQLYAQISNCLSNGDIIASAKSVFAGGIVGSNEWTTREVNTGLGTIVYISCGAVEFCISESKINASASGENSAYIGGISGFVREAGFKNGDATVYYGGSVSNCFFTGECITDSEYFGNIAGVSGSNIYENNSYVSDGKEYFNFDKNYYVNSNSKKAFGATVNPDGNYASVEDKGATSAAIESIKNNETYNSILEALAASGGE